MRALNTAPHRTAIPLRSIAAGELGRYEFMKSVIDSKPVSSPY